MSELERIYRLYRSWNHAPREAYAEARMLVMPLGRQLLDILAIRDLIKFTPRLPA